MIEINENPEDRLRQLHAMVTVQCAVIEALVAVSPNRDKLREEFMGLIRFQRKVHHFADVLTEHDARFQEFYDDAVNRFEAALER